MSVFKKEYAEAYDLLYHSKDYEKECDFIEAVIRRSGCNVEIILDLGCGTGGHALILARRGYKVVGIDRSQDMIDIAKRKAENENLSIEYIKGDITGIDLNRKFDAVISMFAVMGYQTTNSALAAACHVAGNHLRPNGIFLFDSWYGPAVLTDKPGMRIKEIVLDDNPSIKRIIRFTEPVIDTLSHIVETRFKVWRVEGDRLVSETNESHFMRYLFPQEIKYFLEVAGFKNIEFCPFLELERTLTEHDWNMGVIARR
jgi:SAM-dependent methyltransferase